MLNIDPDTAAESYRQRALAQMGDNADEAERAQVLTSRGWPRLPMNWRPQGTG